MHFFMETVFPIFWLSTFTWHLSLQWVSVLSSSPVWITILENSLWLRKLSPSELGTCFKHDFQIPCISRNIPSCTRMPAPSLRPLRQKQGLGTQTAEVGSWSLQRLALWTRERQLCQQKGLSQHRHHSRLHHNLQSTLLPPVQWIREFGPWTGAREQGRPCQRQRWHKQRQNECSLCPACNKENLLFSSCFLDPGL